MKYSKYLFIVPGYKKKKKKDFRSFQYWKTRERESKESCAL